MLNTTDKIIKHKVGLLNLADELGYARTRTAPGSDWVNSLLERRPARLVTVAMANKTARIAWAILAKREIYQTPGC